jgi:hypothetical protein
MDVPVLIDQSPYSANRRGVSTTSSLTSASLSALRLGSTIINHPTTTDITTIYQDKENMSDIADVSIGIMNDTSIHTRAFRISPNNEKFPTTNARTPKSPVKSPNSANISFVTPLKETTNTTLSSGSGSGSHNSHGNSGSSVVITPMIHTSVQGNGDYDHKKLKREIQDLKIVNKDLIHELECLQDEIKEKNQMIDIKSTKIDDLMHENNKLLGDLKMERESNEQDFESWLDLKTKLELQIHDLNAQIIQLRKALQQYELGNAELRNEAESEENIQMEEYYSKLKLSQTEIKKLRKKVNALSMENELELQSKLMIIEELEMMKERYLEESHKHESLKLDHNTLVDELLHLRDEIEEDYSMEYTDDDLSETTDDTTPTLEKSTEMQLQDSTSELNEPLRPKKLSIKKKRISSRSSNSRNSNVNSRIASLRNNSLNRAIRDAELNSLSEKYQIELRDSQFEIKSLKLQNHHLLAFIGYTLQLNEREKEIIKKRSLNLSNVFSSPEKREHVNSSRTNCDSRVTSIGSTISNTTENDTNVLSRAERMAYPEIDYSDKFNISTAKKNLKGLMKSVSATALRSGDLYVDKYTTGTRTSVSTGVVGTHVNGDTHNIFNYEAGGDTLNDDFIMDVNSNSMDYSTDYNQGEVKPFEMGESDVSEGFGDDEYDDDDDDDDLNLNMNMNVDRFGSPLMGGDDGDIVHAAGTANDNVVDDNSTEKQKRMSGSKTNFTSTGSLNGVYKVNITPHSSSSKRLMTLSVSSSGNTDGTTTIPALSPNGKGIRTTRRNHVKKMTPSSLNLFSKASGVDDGDDDDFNYDYNNYDENYVLDGIDHDATGSGNNGMDNYVDGDVDGEVDMSIDLGLKLNGLNIAHDSTNNNTQNSGRSFIMSKSNNLNNICEEGESEFDSCVEVSTSDDEDEEDYDEDGDISYTISPDEIEMFRLSAMCRFYCPKHSMFQCFCKAPATPGLLHPYFLKLFLSPFYMIRRSLGATSTTITNSTTSNTNIATGSVPLSRGNSVGSFKLRNELSGPMRYHKHRSDIQNVNVKVNNGRKTGVISDPRSVTEGKKRGEKLNVRGTKMEGRALGREKEGSDEDYNLRAPPTANASVTNTNSDGNGNWDGNGETDGGAEQDMLVVD